MDEIKTVEDLREAYPELVSEVEATATVDDAAAETETAEEEATVEPDEQEEAAPEVTTEADRIGALELRLRRSDAARVVTARLAAANLPPKARTLLEADFADAECADEAAFGTLVEGRIATVREALAESAAGRRVTGAVSGDATDGPKSAKDMLAESWRVETPAEKITE